MQRLNAAPRLGFAGVCAAALLLSGTAPKAYAMSFGQYAAACAANGGRAIVQNGVYACVFGQPVAPLMATWFMKPPVHRRLPEPAGLQGEAA